MNMRTRMIALVAVCMLALGGAAAYLVVSRASHNDAVQNAPTVAQTSVDSVQNEPHIVFRNTALGSQYGMVAMVSLSDPSGPRAITKTSCDRVYSTSAEMICLSSQNSVVATTYAAEILNAHTMAKQQSVPFTGIPSRARLSTDGKLAATTAFVAGDSYQMQGFSTRTNITQVGGTKTSVGLEDFTIINGGEPISPPTDRNFWGVTFAQDDNTFYATVLWGGKTRLVRGDLKARTVTTLHEDAECPSLSPDGTKIVFKQRAGAPVGQWRLAEYDLKTGETHQLQGDRSVDDQVEWLDNDHVIYGLARSGSGAAVDDIWSVAVDGKSQPKLLIPQAWSPAVVR